MRGRLAVGVAVASVAALFAGGVVCGAGCGGVGTAAPAGSHSAPLEPRWEDVFDTLPELIVDIHPTALRSDPVYGPLLRRAIELARRQSRVVAETRALDSMEDAEEVIAGLRQGGPADSLDQPDPSSEPSSEAGDVVVVIRGVRADVDPAGVVDGDGKPLWSPGPQGPVRELVRLPSSSGAEGANASPDAVSLFELPGRTWLIATGDTRLRARGVFARPLGRPPLHFGAKPDEGDPLALVRMDGPTLASRIRALRPHGALSTVGRRLRSVTLELTAGASAHARSGGGESPAAPDAGPDRDVRATLAYADEDAAAFAEITVRDVLSVIARKNPNDLGWLGSAAVDRPGKRLELTAALPAAFVDALAHMGARVPVEKAAPGQPTPAP